MNSPVPQDWSVIITPTEMYHEQRATHDEVKGLGQKLDTLTDNVVSSVADHEARLRTLERRMWMYAGGILVIATGLSYLVQMLSRWQ